MFPLTSKRTKAHRDGQSGFTLIEVVVAVGLLVLVLVALLPEMVVGVRATAGAKNLTQAKGVLQARLEIMRSMPYHVGPAAGPFRDVLDTYYPNLVEPTTTPDCAPGGLVGAPLETWSGFVSTDSTQRCTAYEPAVGTSFYRYVKTNIAAAGLGAFTLVVDSAFLSWTVPPVSISPGAGYTSSDLAGLDAPKSGLLGVWATVVYRQSAALKPVTTYTQISQRTPVDSSLLVNATVDAIRVTSQSPTALMTLDAGVVAQSGARFTGSQVHMNANAASAGMGTGFSANGATAALSAPPSTLPGSTSVTMLQSLTPSAPDRCQYVCIGSTTVEWGNVSASDGLPLSASPATPVRVTAASEMIRAGTESAKYGGFLFNNIPDVVPDARGLSSSLPMVTMDANAPVASVQSGCESIENIVTAPSNLFSATGFLVADPIANASPTARSCVTARTAPVMLFPTTAVPGGIIQVSLDQSSLQCKVIRSAFGVRTATAVAKFSATVKYWGGPTLGYVLAGTINETTGTDPLKAILTSNPSVGGTLRLRNFIQDWRAAISTDVVVSHENTPTNPAGSNVRAKLAGVVSIDSQPTRADLTVNSVVSVTVGTFTCDVKDVR